MSSAARVRVRLDVARILRQGLYAALHRYLPSAALTAWHQAQGGRQRRYTPLVTVWALIHQVLCHTSDARTAQQVAAWLGLAIAPRSGSYAKARARLPQDVLAALVRETGARGQRRRPRLILDGTTTALADTLANQRTFPQPPQQSAGCGFPVMRVVVLLDAHSGAVVDWTVGHLNQQDAYLGQRLWDRIPPGAVVLADRGFASYAFVAAMVARGVDVVVRQHEQRRNRRPGDALDWDETWPRPVVRQPWWLPDLPEQLPVRVIYHRLPSGRWLKLNTTLSRRAVSAAHLAETYRGRWTIETQFAALKVGLAVAPLAATRPELALTSLYAAFLTLNLLSAVRVAAARSHGVDPWRLSLASLAGALRASLTQAWRSARAALRWVVANVWNNPARPGRHEPRVKKRRPKDYPYMTHPRHAFRDTIACGRA